MPIDDRLASEQWTRFQYCVDLDAWVLTEQEDYIQLRYVTTDHKVWDGFGFVRHEGLILRGNKECVRVDGVWMTPDHKVLVAGKWVEAGKLVPDSPLEMKDVADLLNCGPHYRFTVMADTAPMIVSNCRDRGHLDFINKADKCEKFFAGDQWLETDLNALRLQRRPALTINKIISTLGTLFGEQIYNRSETIFRPSTGATPELAEIMTKVFKQISQNNQLPWARSELFADGIIRSRGFLDIRLDFTDSMLGEVRITNLNSKNVIIDPDAEEYDPDSWNDVFITKWVTPQDIAILYSEDDSKYLQDKDGSSFPYGYDSIERVRDRFGGVLPLAGYYGIIEPHGVRRNIRLLDRQYRRLDKQLHFVDVETGDMRPVPESWDRNRIAAVLEKAGRRVSTTKKLIKRIRWTVTADNCVLHDDWSPYKHFTTVPYFPYFRYGRTIGLVENLLGPQEVLNKVTSQELHVVNTTANSGWKLKAGSLKNMTTEELEQKGATTGLVLELDDVASAEKITPNATPQGLDRLSYKAEEHIKGISNISDSMQGFDREDVAAKAIQAKQSRGSINMTKVMDNLERTDYILARNIIDLVQEFYTEPRIMHITHDDLLNESEEIQVNTYNEMGELTNDLTMGEYSIIITSTPYRATLEDSQFEQAMTMREAGIQIPDDVLIENSRLQRKSEIVKRMQGDQNSPEAQQQKQLQARMQAAQVAVAEADAQVKQADTQLKLAKTKKELASIEQEDQRLALDAQNGESPEKAAQEMQIEREKHGNEMDMKREEHAMDMQMKREEHAMKREDHQTDTALKIDQHEHNKRMQEEQAENQALQSRADELNAQRAQPKEKPE